MAAAVQVTGLGKQFRHRGGAAPMTFRGWVASGFASARGAPFWALQGLDFAVAPGEMLGVIGRNGAGKSTLLRLLAGVMRADAGQVVTAGPVNGLLELNTGMHPDLTGRENIRINGVLGGLLRAEVEARMDQIIAFAELSDHIDDPLRTYSSGMKLRLGFAVAVHVDPRILLIDEVLSVGDLGFQQKCLARIRAFKEQGAAIVLISHDLTQVRAMCDRVLWLDHGQVRGHGPAAEVVAAYEAAMEAERVRRVTQDAVVASAPVLAGNSMGTREAELVGLAMTDAAGVAISRISPGGALRLAADVRANRAVSGWHMSVTMTDAEGRNCLDISTETDRVVLPSLPASSGAEGQVRLELAIERLDLAPGRYVVSVGLWRADWADALDYRRDGLELLVEGGAAVLGVLSPPRVWRIQEAGGL